MAVTVNCPGCRTSYPVTEDLLGKKIRCKKCQETFTATAPKSAAATRSDDRITNRPPSKAGAVRVVSAVEDDDTDEAPRRNGNGRARPAARRPATKEGGGKGLLIGGIIGGILVLAGGFGIAMWVMNRDDGSDTNSQTNSNTGPAISSGTTTTTPTTKTDVTPPPVEPTKTGTTTPAVMKTGNGPEKLDIVRGMARPGDIRPETVERVKKSAAWITVTSHEGLGWGSGWIAEVHGNEAYVITNSHVVGMKEVSAPPPEKIVVTLDTGLPTQREFDAKLLALDREEDLAVLRIKGPNLPAALKIAPSYDLLESQRLFTMGFPHGGSLVKDLKRGLKTGDLKTTLKVRPTSVSGRVYNKDGSVKYIQIEGGVDPGNSGGAAVDTNGNLVAIVVAQQPGTNMKFIIPSEYAIHMLLGRVLKVIPGQAVGSVGAVHQPIVATVVDPLKRLQRVDAEVFVGVKPDLTKGEKPIRMGGDREPEPKPGDGPRAVAALNYDPETRLKLGDAFTATADLTLPAVKDTEVYWFQPHYYAKDGSQRWGEAIVMDMGRYPVEAKPAHLELANKTDQGIEGRALEIDSRQAFGYQVEGVGANGQDLGLRASLTERVSEVNKNGDAKLELKYKDLHLSDSDTETMIRKQLKGVLEAVKYLKAVVTVTKDGKFVSPKAITVDVPREAQPILRRFNDQIIESLEAMTLSLPNKDVQPGETWEHESPYTFNIERFHQNALIKLTCTFVGTRIRDGREEAVVEIVGRVAKNTGGPNGGPAGRGGPGGRGGPAPAPPPASPGGGDSDSGDESLVDEDGGLKVGVQGGVHGAAVVDIATGRVTLGRTESELAVVFPVSMRDPEDPQGKPHEFKVYAGLYLDVTVRRSLTKEPPKPVDVSALLPNQPRVYNPLVGVGAPTLGETAPSYAPERSTLMEPEVWNKLKHSAVMLRVERNDGGGEGSGWFAAPGMIVTNVHVVGMLNKADRPPEKISVFLDRGTEQERRLTGELLAINREDDLAVVRVTADHLPEPMKIAPSKDLIESNKLSVLGFPQGSGLAADLGKGLGVRDLQTTLKARSTTVSGRIPNADGSIKFIQLEGGADHGNSGGAIVDAKGEVRAVLDAGDPSSEMRFGIPSEYADRMIQGYPLETLPGRSYMDGSVPKQPVEIRFSDPVGKLSAVNIDYWVGSPGKPITGGDKPPKSNPGDGPRQSATLALKTSERPGERLAAGDFVLPSLDPGKIYWLQPRYTNGTGKEQFGRAIAYRPDGPPVERKPAKLEVKYRKNSSRDVELVTYTQMYTRTFGRGRPEGYPLKVNLTEKVIAANATAATIQIVYQGLDLDINKIKEIVPGLEDIPPAQLARMTAQVKPLLNLIRGVAMFVNVTKDGKMKVPTNGLSYRGLPPQIVPQMHDFNNQIFASLQALTFPLPGKEVPYGHSWEFPTNLFIAGRNKSEAALFKMQFKYVGVRQRAGRTEAVVEITGSLAGDKSIKGLEATDGKAEPEQPKPPDGDSVDPASVRFDEKPAAPEQPKPEQPKKGRRGLYGVARGFALVDVNDGFISEVKLYIDLDMEVMQKDPVSKRDVPVDAGGTMDLHLIRHTAK
jgi:predicted Zn finger-like uncharacterized protein